MEVPIPLDVLVDICINYLDVRDVLNMYQTCTYWKSVIDDFNILEKHRFRLMKKAQTSCFQDEIEEIAIECDGRWFPLAKVALLTERPCEHEHKSKCAIFKTHHSHAKITLFDLRNALGELHSHIYPHKFYNNLEKKWYREHRSSEVIAGILSSITQKIEYFVYMYPMSLTEFIERAFIEICFLVHASEVVCVPRVLMLCIDLCIENAIVVFSTSQTTEIAVIVNGCVVENRWCEVPVGGWNVSKHLYEAVRWDHPHSTTKVAQLEHRKFKSICWIKANSNMSERLLNTRRYKFKKEQYLAPELMYAELDLCANISKLLDGLPEQDIENCLGHVLLTGGNCKLKHFDKRVKRDLIQTFPKYKNIIATSVHLAHEHIYEKHDIVSFVRTIEPGEKFTAGKCCRIPVKDFLGREEEHLKD